MSDQPKPKIPAFLKNPANGVVFIGTQALVDRGDLVECDKEGNEVGFEEVSIPVARPAAKSTKGKKVSAPQTPEELAEQLTNLVPPTPTGE